ncbi:hypothetical protein [Marinagarivorans algicola]|uniref:hypothetical protein n=1 Tax=Marinagarivorans algicola TaxID=1513270 RepID=UPI0009E8BD29|nr:hypothetical protein [Marinagarivorans algicola]
MILINSFFLAEPAVFDFVLKQMPLLLTGELCDFDGGLKEVVYTACQQKHNRWPDQVFLGYWDDLIETKHDDGSWSRVLLGQAVDYYFDQDNRRLAIDRQAFDAWQGWVANQCALPVVAYQLVAQLHPAVVNQPFELLATLREKVPNSSLPCVYHRVVEDYIARQGLHESHMHLNGTTSIESLWCHVLCHPEATVEYLTDSLRCQRVKLLYAANTVFKQPNDIHHLFIVARQVREALLLCLNGPSPALRRQAIQTLKSVLTEPTHHEALSFPLEKALFSDTEHRPHLAELHWQVRLLAQLKAAPDPLIDACYLLYILCMNNFQRFAVQRTDQAGFDWFQKFADDGVREHIELAYEARFRQLQGNSTSGAAELATLECRIAPKSSNAKNINLLSKVFEGFLCYHQGAEPYALHSACDLNDLALKVSAIKKPALRLVTHFIKRPWQPKAGEAYYQTLRNNLLTQAHLLVELLDNNPALKKILTGIDAAANELEAPPDVFAGLYRFCRYHHIRHFTYHVGEDFKHLVSGIRAVHDAVTLLALRNGDRLGHATAIGILPKQWFEPMPKFIYMEQGAWLDDLLFVRQVVLSTNTTRINLEWVEREIRRLIALLLPSPMTIDVLQDAFKYRHLLPEALEGYLQGQCLSYTSWLWQEIEAVKKAKEHVGLEALECLRMRWFDVGVLMRSAKKTKVCVTGFDADALLLLQQYVQHEIEKYGVVIETLPTSNIRISHYQSMHEHHVFRWLKIPERAIDGDANLMVSLGSDDPGIFSTSIKNEFYHIFCTLMKHFSYSPEEALKYAAQINENGRIYRFDGY